MLLLVFGGSLFLKPSLKPSSLTQGCEGQKALVQRRCLVQQQTGSMAFEGNSGTCAVLLPPSFRRAVLFTSAIAGDE